MGYAQDAYAKAIQRVQFQPDMGLDKLRGEVNRFWDGVQTELGQSVTDPYIRNAYRMLIQQAKTQNASFGWLDEPEVYQSITKDGRGRMKKPWAGILAGVILAGLTGWFALPLNGLDLPLLIASGAALLLLLIQWLASAIARGKAQSMMEVHTHTEQRLGVQRIHSTLEYMTKEMDAHAEGIQASIKEIQAASCNGDIVLVRELLKLPENMRSEAVTDAVNMYLVRNGIRKVNYSKENEEMFMILPADFDKTIEPALIKDDKLLSTGVACVKAEG